MIVKITPVVTRSNFRGQGGKESINPVKTEPKGVIEVVEEEGDQVRMNIEGIESMPEKHGLRPIRCTMCGGELVFIRGKSPDWEKRLVCPKCDHE